ncbi:HAMP domain-containing sensor histidine kinase [Bacillus sp. 31A1R]|uniref:Heme sensor protein HssS n=1 Tax=Robertmurraya mangrovi TaxID=3098077 RepID=A0ABU5IYR8_9BACI|nr:HAMP domain-containing sensor histidine kinase [Bacillus sp. 31A1R]MDZ5472299.1 HAMP domain-containing sensor histidine kinase [Bacillus sp. 31A1R]
MKSLYIKFVVITIGIMMVSSIFAFLISNTYYQQKLKPFNDEKITKIAQSIATFTEHHPNMDLEEYLENLSTIGYQMYLMDDLGGESYFGAPFRDKSLTEETKRQVLDGQIFHGILQFPQETFVTGFFANELKNTIGVPLTHNGKIYALFVRPDIKLLFNEMHLLFGWLLAFTILLSTIMVVFSTKYLVKPITKLTKATTSLANGRFDVELELSGQDELGELSKSFLRMAKKLEQMEDMRKEFISNISHDIQSPLSNIKGYINLIDQESITIEERRQYVSIINGEITRLSTLTKQLLLLASLDRDVDILKKKPFNVGQQLKELIRNYQWQISEKGIMLSYHLPDTEMIGDPSLLHTVWENLLTNAIKYNKPDGSIDISIEDKGESISVTVSDTGIGLTNAETERIFDRFYRADTARTRTIEGTGLGLSIVWTIVKMHGGQITVNSKEKEGSSFIVEIPSRDGGTGSLSR